MTEKSGDRIMLSQPSVWAVFAMGVSSFLSPCVWPLVPAYIAWLTSGDRTTTRLSTVLLACMFVAGFTIVFTAMGATASVLGRLLARYDTALRWIGGLLIIALGLFYMGLLRAPFLERERRLDAAPAAGRLPALLRALVMGMALAMGWTPCIGPALGSSLALAARAGTMARGAALLFVYGMGMGLPFLAMAACMDALMPLWRKLLPRLPLIRRIGGALLVLTGIAQLAGWLTWLSAL